MAFLLCCGGRRSQSPPLLPPDTERLRTLHPSSLVSIVLPSDTIPHRPSTGIDETQALRDIFGVSPSSHRGYQAAAKSSGSFDTNFKFGHDNPPQPKNKAQSPIKKLGYDIRQRLSQARLSTHSSRKSMREIKSTETVVHTKMLATSQVSTGLDDILVSRTVSEGGYDSDAKGIQTPEWTKASAGSFLVSPEYTARVLNAFDNSPGKRSASIPRTPRASPVNNHSPAGMNRTPSTTRKRHAVLQKKRPAEKSPQINVRAISTPQKPTTPQREPFSAFLQLGPQESPSDVLRRLSVGLANGKIQLPDTPELKAMRMPSIGEAVPEWRLSFAAPKRASSLHRQNPEVKKALKTLSDRVEKAKRESVTSDWTADDKHVSLLSNIDPVLLQYLSRYSDEEDEPDHRHEATGNGEEGGKHDLAYNQESDLDTTSHADTSGLLDIATAEHPEHKHSSSLKDANRRNTGLESEKESIHLFDMRISQRLASTSVFPTTYPSSADLRSNKCPMDRSSQSFGKLDASGGYAGQPSGEHLRRPSDPRTRRLFEPESALNGQKLHPRWKSVKSTNRFNPEKPAHGAEVSRDDASSVYLSDAGLEDSEVKSFVSHMARSNSLLNPSSVAIAGRDGAQSIPNKERRTSMGHAASTDAPNKTNLSRSSTELKGKESKFSEEFGLDRRTIIGKMESEGANTLAHERMSTAEVMDPIRPGVDPNERMSEIDFAGALTERLTASTRKQRGMSADTAKTTLGASQGTKNHDRLTADGVKISRSGTSNFEDEPARTNPRGREECATNMWERALTRAKEDQSFEGSERSFRKSFNQLRRVQTRDRSFSATQTSHYHVPGDASNRPARHSRSLSPHVDASRQNQRESFNLDKHQSLCVEAKKPLARSTSPHPSVSGKKRSFLDIRRFTTARNLNANGAVSSPAAASPNRDFLAWARFPSHTRQERNGPAADKDCVLTRDFSPPTDKGNSSSQDPSKLSLVTQSQDNIGAHGTTGSWRLRKFGHGRKKSRSMNFPVPEPMRTEEEEKEKMRKKSSFMTLTMSLAKWKRMYRSHSGDLRTIRAGHRSSVSKGGKVEFPELEIVPGFDGVSGSADGVGMEQVGNVGGETRRGSEERALKMESSRVQSKSREAFGGSLGKRNSASKTMSNEELKVQTKDQLSFDGNDDEPTPRRHRLRTPAAPVVVTGENAWAETYRDCVVEDDDDDYVPHHGLLVTSDAHLLGSEDTMDRGHGHHTSSSSGPGPAGAEGEGEDSYFSCSVSMSDHDYRNDLPPPRSQGRGFDGNASGSAGDRERGHAESDDDNGDGATVRHRPDSSSSSSKRLFLVSSSEERDSTKDFRMQLHREERRVREELLRTVGMG